MLIFFWLNGSAAPPTPPPTPHDTAGDAATGDEIRALERAAKSYRDARQASDKKRSRIEERLTHLVDKAWRKVVLQEPDTAAEIAASVSGLPGIGLPSSEALRSALVSDASGMAAFAARLGDWLWQQETMRLSAAAEASDEEDIETLLLLVN